MSQSGSDSSPSLVDILRFVQVLFFFYLVSKFKKLIRPVVGSSQNHRSLSLSGSNQNHRSLSLSGSNQNHTSLSLSGSSQNHRSLSVSGSSQNHRSLPGSSQNHPSPMDSYPEQDLQRWNERMDALIKKHRILYRANLPALRREIALVGGPVICAICLEDCQVWLNRDILNCGHQFHATCVIPWLKKKPNCPVCRRPC